jgi:protein-disulfide isomerase
VALGLVLSLLFAGQVPPAAASVPPARTGDTVAISVSPNDPSIGSPGAPVTLIEFADFQCPFCRRVQPLLDKLLVEYRGRIRLIHKDLPLDIHDRAFPAATAARCAAEQHRFWEFRRALFATPSLEDEGVRGAASASGVALAPFEACIASHRYDPLVKESIAEALSRGFYSTPTFVINDRVMVGVAPIQDFRSAIDKALATGHR